MFILCQRQAENRVFYSAYIEFFPVYLVRQHIHNRSYVCN